jgi:ABC-type transport system involved in multi-copper enzyme maturation permease subunit
VQFAAVHHLWYIRRKGDLGPVQKILAIARNTFREAIRDRILYGFLFFAVVLILFSLVLGQLSLGEQVRVTLDVGLSGISLFAVLMSIFIGIALLHKEIEKRTIYPVLSKPVSRAAYLVGKFLGLAATMAVQIALMSLVFFLVLALQGGSLHAGLFLALALTFVETLLVISMALFFTSFSRPFLSGLFSLGVFTAGRNADLISELAEVESLAWLSPVLDGATAVLPNLYLFYPSGKLVEGSWATVHEQFVSSGYLVSATGYGLAYTTAFLLLSIALLGRRDFI